MFDLKQKRVNYNDDHNYLSTLCRANRQRWCPSEKTELKTNKSSREKQSERHQFIIFSRRSRGSDKRAWLQRAICTIIYLWHRGSCKLAPFSATWWKIKFMLHLDLHDDGGGKWDEASSRLDRGTLELFQTRTASDFICRCVSNGRGGFNDKRVPLDA